MILARREAPGLFASLASTMGEAGGVPEDVLEVAEMQTIISLVAGGFGVSLVPESVGQIDRSGVAFRAIAGPHGDDRAGARLAPGTTPHDLAGARPPSWRWRAAASDGAGA